MTSDPIANEFRPPPHLTADMNWFFQLNRLILDFYREDPNELRQLQALHHCRISRRWGVLRINCRTLESVNRIVAAASLIKAPIAQLRIAQQIDIYFHRDRVATMPITSSKLKT